MSNKNPGTHYEYTDEEEYDDRPRRVKDAPPRPTPLKHERDSAPWTPKSKTPRGASAMQSRLVLIFGLSILIAISVTILLVVRAYVG